MPASQIVRHNATVTREHRQQLNGHKSVIIWFTGLSASGKSTLAHAVEEQLHRCGYRTFVLDGDNIRYGLCKDLGFTDQDRKENIRRVAELAKLLLEAGVITLAAFISPFNTERQQVRELVPEGDFFEIYCKCEIAVCEQRDPKGLYKKARLGEITNFTGISSSYEAPQKPELILETDKFKLNECVNQVLTFLEFMGILSSPYK
ncbi:MAG: adenylyl-sulfate kinase [Methylococcaceae bacterium]|jgi:adenylylsulfate kinase